MSRKGLRFQSSYRRPSAPISGITTRCPHSRRNASLEASETGKITKKDLFRIYRRWCAREGFKPVNQRELKQSLTQIFPKLDEYRAPGGKGPWQWMGITLTDDGQAINNMAEEIDGGRVA